MSKLFDAVDGAESALMYVRQAKAIAGLRGDAYKDDSEDADVMYALVSLLHEAQTLLEAVQKISLKDDAPQGAVYSRKNKEAA